jgi:hypothetical protein
VSNKEKGWRKRDYWAKNLARSGSNLRFIANTCESFERNAGHWDLTTKPSEQTAQAKQDAKTLRDNLPFMKAMVEEIEKSLAKLEEVGF